MDYRLDELGWFEFEQMVQALLKAKLGMGVEAWGCHGDLGRDAYFKGTLKFPTNEPRTGSFVFQAKFVENANASGAKPNRALFGAIRKEVFSIKKKLSSGTWDESPYSYAFFTNSKVTPSARTKIEEIVSEALPESEIRIFSGHDLCQWLRNAPEIATSFPQLLSLRDLKDLIRDAVNADTLARSESALTLAKSFAPTFVPTAAYYLAQKKLREFGFVVLEGPPEMGKTTIGRMIALSQLASGWDALEVRTATEVLENLKRERKQVFVADDFFGRTEYQPTRVSQWQEELSHIIPILDASHWLILTCRAHLFEMGKFNLDIAGQNDRFPELGEVVVDAGRLTQSEKARVLYRHAKTSNLSGSEKGLVRWNAPAIVEDTHFTPERIRRLVCDLVPKLASDTEMTMAEVEDAIAESLSDPTKQMQISFRQLPNSHKWLLYALLDTGDSRRKSILKRRYEALCPLVDDEPFEKVIDELSEAFIRKPETKFERIDWIHPSCRDLAIDELASSRNGRAQFFRGCSRIGLALACSIGGGATGQRNFPLLASEEDWRALEKRAINCLKDDPAVFEVFQASQEAIDSADRGTCSDLNRSAAKIRSIISERLLPEYSNHVQASGYSNPKILRTYFQTCESLRISPSIDLDPLWEECEKEAKNWGASEYEVWEGHEELGKIQAFLNTLSKFASENLEELEGQVRVIGESILTRDDLVNFEPGAVEIERASYEDAADGYERVALALSDLAKVSSFEISQKQSFDRLRKPLEDEAINMYEHLPDSTWDSNNEDSRMATESIDIGELFGDL